MILYFERIFKDTLVNFANLIIYYIVNDINKMCVSNKLNSIDKFNLKVLKQMLKNIVGCTI